ncbi:MAG: leucine-rich repeat domain-containing protein, partial [Prevotella sp.]|nr:leucine-rich repeat domain-containing protein [Prevotella sp.]
KGENHWETLGPKDVIPGNNIFGVPTPEELKGMTEEQVAALPPSCAKDFRILVSPARYLEFIKDPNWAMYAQFIEAADYEPTTKKSIVKDGLTYEYMSTSAGMLSTDNVVSQNWSWWSVPVLAAEIALYAYAAYKVGKGVVQAISAGDAASGAAGEAISEVSRESVSELSRETVTAYANTAIASEATLGAAKEFAGSIPVFARGFTEAFTAEQISAIAGKNLADIGFSSYAISQLASEGFCSAAGVMYSADVLTKLLSTNIARTTLCSYAAKVVAELTATLAPEVVVPEVAAVVSSMGLPAWASQTLVHMADGVLLSSLSASLITARMQGSDYNSNKFRSGLIANNLSYIHAASLTGIGLNMIYTPSKNMVYHQYISKAEPNISKVNIYAGVDDDTRTMTFRKNVFAGNIFLEEVCFYEAKGSTTKESVPMTIAIPDSAFVGCINMKRFDLRLYTGGKPSQALGPENFILCGDNIFAGCDSTKLKIIIAKDRKQDFLDDGMWSKYKRFFAYEETEYPDVKDDFGVKYVYAYEGNSTQKVSMKNGHKVEHLVAWGPDDSWINDHKGQLGLFNDIGIYNNYKLDYVRKEAFRGNQNLKGVSCWDIKGWLWCGDIYYDFNVALQDSCFADCPNLEAFDLLYLCTDGINKAKELHPSQLQLGNGVFANTPKLMLKMTQQQQRWFEADTTWAKYKDKFTPCLVKPVDAGVKKALKDLHYTTAVGSPSTWDDVIDMSKLKDKGFEWLNGKLAVNNDIKLFPEFKQFEWAGLDFIGGSWFVNDYNLTAIELPSTIKKIGGYAFQNCDLREIEIPAAVTRIDEMAFNGNANMKVIRCLGTTPAALGTAVFEKPEGLKIYVPAEAVNAYKEKWSDYKDYIVAASDS